MKPLSDLFISLVRSIVPVLIFATVASGIASMGNIKRVGGVGLRALVYFEVVSTLALVIGMVVGNLVLGGVTRMAGIRAVTNLFGNIFATVVIAKVMGELDEGLADKALHPGSMH